tara:strand:- start:16496 stop:17833 length:1338 start_codon:yes stop_codon:yes gene_type:complete
MKLFGTDGIRGEYGIYPLDNSTIRKIGTVLSEIYSKNISKFYIAHDGRASHSLIYQELVKGIISSKDFDIIFLDLLPTPSLPYILSEEKQKDAMGIQITASHNPYTDNGLKIFDSSGYKISENDENRIEQLLNTIDVTEKNISITMHKNQVYVDNYLKHLTLIFKKYVNNSMKLNVALDCANGALSHVVKSISLPDNISFTIFNDSPNGRNINEKCGAVHPEYLSKFIIERNKNLHPSDNKWIDFGMTFDGDGDRALLISESGRIIDGDEILLILSNMSIKNLLVGTVMTNYGIRMRLREMGHDFIETDVGDKHVLSAILNNHAFMGSESSGHLIHTDVCEIPIGDAMITLIKMIHTIQLSKKSVDEIYPKSLKMPSKLINIETTDPKKLIEKNHLNFKKIEELLYGNGRILVRESGTQSMVRILLEHKSSDAIDEAERIIKSLV